MTTVEETLDGVRQDLNRVKLNWGKEKTLIETLDAVITALKIQQQEFKTHERRFTALENDFGDHLLDHEKKEAK